MTRTDVDRTNEPPEGLGRRGLAFWHSATSDFDFTDAEIGLLEEACRTLDDLDALAASVREYGVMTEGSQGQPVVNPALTEARGQRVVLHRLIAALQLPDDEGNAVPTGTKLRTSTAARQRWSVPAGPQRKRAG